MLEIDTRAGSKDLIEERSEGDGTANYLLGTALRITPTILPSADVRFIGMGTGGIPVPVGIEVKRLGDALQCMCDGRFSGTQLPLLREHYGQWAWLLIIGTWRGGGSGGQILTHQWDNQFSKRPTWIESTVG